MNAKDLNKLNKETHEKIAFDKKVEIEKNVKMIGFKQYLESRLSDHLKDYSVLCKKEVFTVGQKEVKENELSFLSGKIQESRNLINLINLAIGEN